MRARMVDWSRSQGVTDLSKVVDAWGIVGLIARCTIGWAGVDQFYENNFRQAQRLGLLFGAYHVLWPWNKDPLREVLHFKAHLNVDGVAPDFVVDDCELPMVGDDAGWKAVSPRQVGAQIVAQVPAMRLLTALPTFVYSRSSWWDDPDHMGQVTPLGIEDDFLLIEAEYPLQAPCGKLTFLQAPEAPRMPTVSGGWTPDRVVMWQWTSCLAPIGVCNASQDGDVLIPSLADFLSIIGQTPPVSDPVRLARLWDAHPELHAGGRDG